MSEAASRGPLERFLGLFADVRRGEATTVLLLTLNVLLLLTCYYFVKPVREALILAAGERGAEAKSYTAAGQALLLLVAVPAYAALASRFPRRRLINVVTLFFAVCLVLFFLWTRLTAAATPAPGAGGTWGTYLLGIVFFLWVGIFNLMVIAQFWSFANDVYTPEQGKRLFAIVAFGASAGAVLGSTVVKSLIAELGVALPLLIAAGLLAVSLLITNFIDTRTRRAPAPEAGEEAPPPFEEEPMGKSGAFALVRGNRYLLLIAFLMLFLNWVNTTGEFILGETVKRAAEQAVASGAAGGLDQRAWIGRFYADFFRVVNVVGLLVQLFLVSRILKYVGVRVSLLVLPVIAFGGYALLAFYPVLSAVRWAKTAENGTDYSLQNTVRNVLFLPTTREQKYKAKQAIDTFFVRAGDVLSALLVYVGTNLLAFRTGNFAMVNLVLVTVWIILAVAIGREHRRITEARA